jgi:hypothetical protein
LAMNTDSCPPYYCDFMMFQYCANGRDWIGYNRSVQNWQFYFTSEHYNRWHVVTTRMPDTLKTVRLRVLFRSDNYNSFEGVGIDDFHVYDSSAAIYDGNSIAVQQPIRGAPAWTEFKKDNRLFAMIQPQGQDIGEMQLSMFRDPGKARSFHGQYYLDRNYVFKPAKELKDSVTLRLYFTDREADSLLFAKWCTKCTLPKNAYKLGISYYKSSDSTELDSSILNNGKGEWSFIANDQVKIVPFMTGYHVEFKAKDAGEFRLANGGLDGKSDLPVQIQQLSAEHLQSNVSLKWNTAEEINIDRFEVEVAEGNTAYANGQFRKVGEVKSKGRSALSRSYSFNDDEPGKNGVRYYQLKSVDAFGNYSYSKSVPVVFNEEQEWQVFPNPSSGKFNFVYQSAAGNTVEVHVLNSVGSLVKVLMLKANGFLQTQEIDLSANYLAAGVYIFKATTNTATHTLKVSKL